MQTKSHRKTYDPKVTLCKERMANYVRNYYYKRGGKDPDAICSHLAGVVTALKIVNHTWGIPLDCNTAKSLMVFIDALETEVYQASGLTAEEILEGAKNYDANYWS